MIPLNKQAYMFLKEAIQDNKFLYDEIYSETKLARELGFSRTPLRDAIHRLAQEGFIDIIPNKGFMVHQITEQDVKETFEVRSALEIYCTFQICKEYRSKRAQRLFKRLYEIMDKMHEVIKTSHSIEEFCEYDFDFHVEMIKYLENEQFSSIFYSLMYRMKTLAKLSLSHVGRMEETYREHLAILKALEKGDLENIYDITFIHMDRPRGINLDDLS